MKKVKLFLFVAILATSCNAQDSKITKDDIAKTKIKIDTITSPEGSWKVNKELDENGNIIKYDSIYTWSSSGNLKGLKQIENDSLLNKMRSMLRRQFSMFNSPNLSNSIDSDSIMKQFFSDDFFSDDSFSKRMPNGFPNLEDIMKRMEAMQQQFFNNNHRYLIPPEKTEKKPILEKERA
ncbi:hypothetical protein [Winogradskyella ursingii]|uniref:hypothetical protein n=1 Tax=Winogradskyella ursingii TaxID=2686079 RepID=UPI0015C7A506|nr:hypothetical protein [Winogradskyella ursingii]